MQMCSLWLVERNRIQKAMFIQNKSTLMENKVTTCWLPVAYTPRLPVGWFWSWPSSSSHTPSTPPGWPARRTPPPPSCCRLVEATAAGSSSTTSERPTTGCATTPPRSGETLSEWQTHRYKLAASWLLDERPPHSKPFCFVFPGCQSHVMVGLWLPDNGHGKSNHSSGQQHVEQHTHLQSGTGELRTLQRNLQGNHVSERAAVVTVFSSAGHGLHRGASLWDHEGAGRQLCARHLWRTDGLFFRWYVPNNSNHAHIQTIDGGFTELALKVCFSRKPCFLSMKESFKNSLKHTLTHPLLVNVTSNLFKTFTDCS